MADDEEARASEQRRLHDRQNRRLTMMVVALLALVVLDVLLLVVGGRAAGWSPLSTAPALARNLSRGITLVCAGVVGLAFLLTMRDKASRAFTRGMRAKDLRRLLKQVRGKRPTDPTELPVVRGYALALAGQSHTLLLPLAVALLLLDQALDLADRGDPWFTALGVTSLAGFAFAVIHLAGQIRAARRFLDEHPEPAQEPSLPA